MVKKKTQEFEKHMVETEDLVDLFNEFSEYLKGETGFVKIFK